MGTIFRWVIYPGEGEPFAMWHFDAAMAAAEKEARDHPDGTVKLRDDETGLLLAIWHSDGTHQIWRDRWPHAA